MHAFNIPPRSTSADGVWTPRSLLTRNDLYCGHPAASTAALKKCHEIATPITDVAMRSQRTASIDEIGVLLPFGQNGDDGVLATVMERMGEPGTVATVAALSAERL